MYFFLAAVRRRHGLLKRAAWAWVFACCAVAACQVQAQDVARVASPTVAAHQAAVDHARKLARELVVKHNLPGLSVAIGLGDDVVWAQGFGWANLEAQVPVTPLTRFRIGSVSKSLTSVAVGLLYQNGRIDLDAPVQKYVPSFPEKRWPVTTRELMAHTAGIRHYEGDEFLNAKHYDGVIDGLAIFENDPLLFKPGKQYHYSSYGWNLVSAVVQAAAHEKFLDFMRTRIFLPLGMRHTVPDYVKRIVPHRVAFYVHDKQGRIRNAPYVDNSYKWASGGFVSTPSDLVRFGFALLDHDLLKPATRDLLWKPVHLASGKSIGRGLDWVLDTDAHGRRTVGHTGGSVGGTTVFVIYPDQRMVVAVTANLSDADGLSAFAAKVANLFAPAPNGDARR
ncbi:MAG TPA: serine hydrolase domain-containing protein [Oleiagrimonas sp.]|nr:serine hydrolase domain-containing protein [Oleiagrimonas sp.]